MPARCARSRSIIARGSFVSTSSSLKQTSIDWMPERDFSSMGASPALAGADDAREMSESVNGGGTEPGKGR
jgi:hypothetical protein